MSRPQRPLAPLLTGVAVAGAWWLVAHNSGSGWVQAVGDMVFGILAVGLLGPPVALRRARLSIAGPAADGRAGSPSELAVRASAALRVEPMDPPGPAQIVGPGASAVLVVPATRGVHERVQVRVSSAAPFGLQWWSEVRRLPLGGAWHVAPRPGPAAALPRTESGQGAASGRRRADTAGDLRAPRPYVRGDSRRHIHWPASAHTGELMVREMESPAGPPVEVRVSLPPGPEGEQAAEAAYGTLLAIVDSGRSAVLVTDERGGVVRGQVEDRATAGRRMARAVASGRMPGMLVVP